MEAQSNGRHHEDNDNDDAEFVAHDYAAHPRQCRRCQQDERRVVERYGYPKDGRLDAEWRHDQPPDGDS